jgi:hypothetical protein
MKTKGCTLISATEGFILKGKAGPLKEGELERTAHRAKEITK